MKYVQRQTSDSAVALDMKDRKILCELSKNSRTPSTQVAKRTQLSRDSVGYRIINFEKRGVIQGYRTVVDITKLGYDVYHLFLQLHNPAKEVESEIIDKLVKLPFVRAVLKFQGRYDLEVALIAKSVKEFDTYMGLILSACSSNVQNYEICTISKGFVGRVLPRSFFSDAHVDTYNVSMIKQDDYTYNVSKNKDKYDEMDLEIISLIANNAEIKNYQIAEKIGLSADAVVYRLKNLLKKGLILRFVPVINFASIGYSIYTILLNIENLQGKKEMKLREFLSTDENVLWAVKSIGRFNLVAYLCVKKTEELHSTLYSLRQLFPGEITNYETMIANEEFKFTYFPEIVQEDIN